MNTWRRLTDRRMTAFVDTSGLYALEIDGRTATRIAPPIPASNSQGRGLAVGNHTVYLTATRGDDGIPCYAYDLTQGASRKAW